VNDRFADHGDNYGVVNFGTMNGNNYFGQARDTGKRAHEPEAPDYEPVEPTSEDFDVAFSFARPDRDYVELTRKACARLGLRVMYDRDLSNHWWGENFIAEQRRIYGSRSRFFVPFISTAYFQRPIPADEFAAATWADVERGGGYILPVLIGDVRLPAHLLPRYIGTLNAEDFTPEGLAVELHRKVNRARTNDGT
jgi:hypothetical protein